MKTCAIGLAVLLLAGCNQERRAKFDSTESVVLSNSAFFPGKKAPGLEQDFETGDDSSETGFIPGPTGSNASDGGFISGPNGALSSNNASLSLGAATGGSNTLAPAVPSSGQPSSQPVSALPVSLPLVGAAVTGNPSIGPTQSAAAQAISIGTDGGSIAPGPLAGNGDGGIIQSTLGQTGGSAVNSQGPLGGSPTTTGASQGNSGANSIPTAPQGAPSANPVSASTNGNSVAFIGPLPPVPGAGVDLGTLLHGPVHSNDTGAIISQLPSGSSTSTPTQIGAPLSGQNAPSPAASSVTSGGVAASTPGSFGAPSQASTPLGQGGSASDSGAIAQVTGGPNDAGSTGIKPQAGGQIPVASGGGTVQTGATQPSSGAQPSGSNGSASQIASSVQTLVELIMTLAAAVNPRPDAGTLAPPGPSSSTSIQPSNGPTGGSQSTAANTEPPGAGTQTINTNGSSTAHSSTTSNTAASSPTGGNSNIPGTVSSGSNVTDPASPSGSTAHDAITIGLSRICSVNRSRVPFPKSLFFEEARKPILTFEVVNALTMGSCGRCSRESTREPIWGQKDYSNVLVSLDLSEVDLLEKRFFDEVWFTSYDIKKRYPVRWRNFYVRALVCDDTNSDGRCADEHIENQLSVNSPGFTLDRIPKSLNIDVWNGRHLTAKGDPRLCEKQYSPLILDLSSDGFDLTAASQGVSFDLNATGEKISTAWVKGKDDAFLVLDRNANAIIDDGGELFGSATILKNNTRAANGFEALRELDSNGDGLFDRSDNAFSDVRLWLDRNHNGVSERGELMRLERANIESIHLDYVDIDEVDPHGNETRQRSTFKRRVKGRTYTLQIIDIWFNTLLSH